MADRRQLVIEELVQRLQTVAGATVVQSDVAVSDADRPVIVVDGGSEAVSVAASHSAAPMIITMTPLILIYTGDPAINAGSEVNALRAAILKAVLLGGDWRQTTGSHGGLKYVGCETSLTMAETMVASLAMNFEIDYILDLKTL